MLLNLKKCRGHLVLFCVGLFCTVIFWIAIIYAAAFVVLATYAPLSAVS